MEDVQGGERHLAAMLIKMVTDTVLTLRMCTVQQIVVFVQDD